MKNVKKKSENMIESIIQDLKLRRREKSIIQDLKLRRREKSMMQNEKEFRTLVLLIY